MLTSQGYNHAIFVAHSFGTAVASWLATFAPKRIGGLVMVDPICFLLNYHHVAFNMLHRVPKQPMEVRKEREKNILTASKLLLF